MRQDDRGRGGRRPRPRDRRFEDDADDWMEDSGEREARPARRRGPEPRRRRPAPRGRPPRRESGGFWSRLFGGGDRPRRRGREGFDWDYAQEDRYDDEREDTGSGRYTGESWDDGFRERDPRAERARPRERLTLMDLATPVFAYAAMLPRDPGGMHPGYDAFREQVLTALAAIDRDAAEHGIDREDAADAVYALSLFMDEQVADSEWTGKGQWLGEPLSIVKLADPEGGINFFRRLDEFGDRRKAVKEVYLVCLAMGYRGRYAELDPTQQGAKIGEIRQRIVRSIYAKPVDSMEVLFPEAYELSAPIEDDVPPPPRWWIAASLGGVFLAIVLWLALLYAAGKIPDGPAEKLKGVTVATTEVRP